MSAGSCNFGVDGDMCVSNGSKWAEDAGQESSGQSVTKSSTSALPAALPRKKSKDERKKCAASYQVANQEEG